MKNLIIDDTVYDVISNAEGSVDHLHRYNENTGMNVSLFFSASKNPALLKEIQKGLKDMSIENIKALTDKV